jgi:hypothetical protein
MGKPQNEVEWPQWVCVVSEEAELCNLFSILEPCFLCSRIPWKSLPFFLKYEQPGLLAACRPGLALAFFMHCKPTLSLRPPKCRGFSVFSNSSGFQLLIKTPAANFKTFAVYMHSSSTFFCWFGETSPANLFSILLFNPSKSMSSQDSKTSPPILAAFSKVWCIEHWTWNRKVWVPTLTLSLSSLWKMNSTWKYLRWAI